MYIYIKNISYLFKLLSHIGILNFIPLPLTMFDCISTNVTLIWACKQYNNAKNDMIGFYISVISNRTSILPGNLYLFCFVFVYEDLKLLSNIDINEEEHRNNQMCSLNAI